MTKIRLSTEQGLPDERSFGNADRIVDAGSAMPDSSPKGKWIRNISAMAAFSVAGTLTGCGAADEAHEKAMSDQIAGLKENLSHCQDNNLEVGDETVLLSYGTFGLKMLKAEKENRFSIGKNSEVEVEQTFLIWPPVTSAEEIIVEGMAENFPTARLGSYWAVVYKSKVPQNKESLVIEVRKKRFVIFIDRK